MNIRGKLNWLLRKLEEGYERQHYTELFADQLIDVKEYLKHMKRIDKKYE